MDCLASIYKELTAEGFSEVALSMINQLTSDIVNGTTDFPRFNQEEHAGLCKAGEILIGASIVASYAAASLAAGSNAEGSKGQPANWEIDEYQEQLIEQWAKASGIWVDNSEQLLISVVKERASIYSTTQKALDAIVLHNYLFPETAMNVIGFTRDSEGLMRIILTQPYVRCLRLATKEEIDNLVLLKGFSDNWSGQGVNYISERIALEDMHPANVFIDEISERAICIDCIVKFNVKSNTKLS